MYAYWTDRRTYLFHPENMRPQKRDWLLRAHGLSIPYDPSVENHFVKDTVMIRFSTV